jgi:hypothetical protein
VVLRHELAVLRLWGVSSVLPVKRMFCEVRLNLRTPQVQPRRSAASVLPRMATKHGALMEPRGGKRCNRSQIGSARKPRKQAKTVAVGCDRVRGGRNAGRSWSGWRPCSGRGRRSRCRHGARRWRRCVGDRRSCALGRFLRRAVRASSGGRGSCAGRGSRPARLETAAGCSDWAAGVRSHPGRSLAAARPAGSPPSWCTSADPSRTSGGRRRPAPGDRRRASRARAIRLDEARSRRRR